MGSADVLIESNHEGAGLALIGTPMYLYIEIWDHKGVKGHPFTANQVGDLQTALDRWQDMREKAFKNS